MEAQASPCLWFGWNRGNWYSMMCTWTSATGSPGRKNFSPQFQGAGTPVCMLHSASCPPRPILQPEHGLWVPSRAAAFSLFLRKTETEDVPKKPGLEAHERGDELWKLCLFSAAPGTRKEEKCFCVLKSSPNIVRGKTFFCFVLF